MPQTGAQTVEIVVDAEVQLDARTTPRPLVDALRRRIRRHQGGTPPPHSGLPAVLISEGGRYRLPQSLLPWLTETCQRKGFTFTVEDRRSLSPCPAYPPRLPLAGTEGRTLRRLLLRDAAVLVASEQHSSGLAAELLARRQQRTLLITGRQAEAARWQQQLGQSLALADAVSPLTRANGSCRVAVACYRELLGERAAALGGQFGMVIFDGLDRAASTPLVQVIRRTSARYLLGLAREPTRKDGLHPHIFLLLGDAVFRQGPARARPPLPLSLKVRPTAAELAGVPHQHYHALLSALARDEGRAAQVCADVTAEARAGQRCLVLSERRDHLERLAAGLGEGVSSVLLTSAVRPAERLHALERLERGEVQVVLTTRQIAMDIFRSAAVSRLFLSFPFAYAPKLRPLVQLLVQPHPGKTDAALFDYHDARVPPLDRSCAKRQGALRRLQRSLDRAGRDAAQLRLDLAPEPPDPDSDDEP